MLAALAAEGRLGGLLSASAWDRALLVGIAVPVALALLIVMVSVCGRVLSSIGNAQHGIAKLI